MLLCALLAGCGNRPPVPSPLAEAGAQLADAATQTPTEEPVNYFRSALAIAPSPAFTPAEAVAPFVWSEQVSEDSVPAQPVTARIAGQPLVIRAVTCRADEENQQPTTWLSFSNATSVADQPAPLDDQSVNIEIPEHLAVGVWTRALGDPLAPTTAAYYNHQAPATAGATPALVTGSRYDWACWLAIDEVHGPVENGGLDTLVGRIALVFADERHSWLAGRFVAEGRGRLP
ncbi:MAG TPA: hypothetical protein DCZ72_06210 [Armatimonadetes bacterium]|nr:hypothetical protein [Armatimonadota bacterium]